MMNRSSRIAERGRRVESRAIARWDSLDITRLRGEALSQSGDPVPDATRVPAGRMKAIAQFMAHAGV